ncbi:MAG: 3D domain-containing protein [Phycisphaerales bacterium JB039]
MTTRQRAILRISAGALAVALTVGSAIFVKERGATPAPLAAIETLDSAPARAATFSISGPDLTERIDAPNPDLDRIVADTELRWFNGRPIRPARTVMFKVTGYSPDARSCGKFADGQTATLHSVQTNAMRMVAADTRVLPFGSMLSIPGYADDMVVPVLDRGGAIKGQRLDLLFPTHEDALQWGVKVVPVTIWEYADGKPADDPRALRD